MRLAISDIGSSARQTLERCPQHGLPGTVIAEFARCCYISLPLPEPLNNSLSPACLCVGHADIQPGPVNLLFDNNRSWQQFRQYARPGTSVSLRADRLVHAGLVCDLSAARVSHDALPLVQAGIAAKPAAGDLVADRLLQLCKQAPADSLAHMLFAPGIRVDPTAHDAVQQAFFDYIYPVCRAFADVLQQNLPASHSDDDVFAINTATVAQKFLGAGRGLTPAGDDLLAGVLLGLCHHNRGAHARKLMQLLQPELAKRTNCVSATLLQQAAQGRAGQSVIAVFAELERVPECHPGLITEMLSGQGHSSGWDCLAGIALLHFALFTPQRTLEHA